MLFRVVVLVSVLVSPWVSASLDVVLEKRCFGEIGANYYFTTSHNAPDHRIKVSSSAYPFDIAFELVQKKSEADLVFIENYFDNDENFIRFKNNSDQAVCKKLTPANATVIQLSKSETSPELTVKLSKYVINKHYKLFVKSKSMPPEQVAALFALMWKTDRVKFLTMLE